jgi:hypothetical protein
LRKGSVNVEDYEFHLSDLLSVRGQAALDDTGSYFSTLTTLNIIRAQLNDQSRDRHLLPR